MGEAKSIVQGDVKTPQAGVIEFKGGILEKITSCLEDIDRAIEIKQNDLEKEGPELRAENHYKLMLLRMAETALLRTKVVLEDYDEKLAINTTSKPDFEEFDPGDPDHEPFILEVLQEIQNVPGVSYAILEQHASIFSDNYKRYFKIFETYFEAMFKYFIEFKYITHVETEDQCFILKDGLDMINKLAKPKASVCVEFGEDEFEEDE